MNDPISWDPSLVKKFSSSNHYKLLNQLRNEVKKYPLNNKKKSSTINNKDNIQDNKNNSNHSENLNFQTPNKSILANHVKTDHSSVSFNNSKNFSIYNNNNNNIISRQNEPKSSDQARSNVDSSSSSFKDRLNQIDMK